MGLFFLQAKFWDTPTPSYSRDLGEYDKLCRFGLRFVVAESADALRLEKRQIEGREKWTFDASITGWLILEPGGLLERHGESEWRIGAIRSNLSDNQERELYTKFKKYWLRGYKPGKNRIKFGPSAAQSLKHYFE